MKNYMQYIDFDLLKGNTLAHTYKVKNAMPVGDTITVIADKIKTKDIPGTPYTQQDGSALVKDVTIVFSLKDNLTKFTLAGAPYSATDSSFASDMCSSLVRECAQAILDNHRSGGKMGARKLADEFNDEFKSAFHAAMQQKNSEKGGM